MQENRPSGSGSRKGRRSHALSADHRAPSRLHPDGMLLVWALRRLGHKQATPVNGPDLEAMRRAARSEYEARYTAERNYKMLMDIFARAMESARRY